MTQAQKETKETGASLKSSRRSKRGRGKPGVAQLKKKADSAFSKYIRYRDGKKRGDEWFTECITCHVWSPLKTMQAGHFIRRSVNALRYSELNVNGQCPRCNVFRYGEQFKYSQELDLKYGTGTAQSLYQRRNEYHKLTIPELQQIIDDSNEQISFYELGLGEAHY